MAGRGIVIRIEGDGESAKQALEMVREQMRETAEEAKKDGSAISQAMESIKTSLEVTGLLFGLREVVDGMREAVAGSAEFGESLQKASERTGLAVGTLSTLHYAAAVTGSDFDGLVSGVSKMDRAIGQAADGNKKAGDFVKALGLNAKQLAGDTNGAEVAFHKFVSTLAATENPIRRNELAMSLLGKAGSAQIPMLIDVADHWDEYTARAKEAGVYLDGEGAAALAATNQKLNDMEQHLKGAALAFTEGLVPAVSQLGTVIGDGSANFEFLKSFGELVARGMAGATMAAYGLMSGLSNLASLGARLMNEGHANGASDYFSQLAEEYNKQAQGARDILVNGIAPKAPPAAAPHTPGRGGFAGTDGSGKGRSDDSIARAAAELVTEQAKAAADARKVADQLELTTLETKHRNLKVSDQEYFAEKLRLQNDELDAEQTALEARQKALQDLYEKQHNDKNSKIQRDKNGNSAAELRTQKELLVVQEQMGTLSERRAKATGAYDVESSASDRATELAHLTVAAELEKQRGVGVAAQIALLQKRNDLEVEKSDASGGSAADADAIRAAGQLEATKLRIADIDRQIRDSEEDNTRVVKELADAAEKDPRFKKAATAQINALNKAEADNLRTLVQQYDALAQQLGGPFLQNAKNLQAEIQKLSTPDNKDSAAFAKTLTEGVEQMGNRIVESAARGKAGFHDMAQGMIEDVARLALKLAEQKWLTPALLGMGLGSGGGSNADANGADLMSMAFGEHHLSGGLSGGGPQVLGEDGPEIWTPPQRGGTVTPTNMIGKLAETGGGGGKGISVVSNVINQTSNPVTAQPAQVSYDSDMKSFIIHTVLEDHAMGGPTSALGSAGG